MSMILLLFYGLYIIFIGIFRKKYLQLLIGIIDVLSFLVYFFINFYYLRLLYIFILVFNILTFVKEKNLENFV